MVLFATGLGPATCAFRLFIAGERLVAIDQDGNATIAMRAERDYLLYCPRSVPAEQVGSNGGLGHVFNPPLFQFLHANRCARGLCHSP